MISLVSHRDYFRGFPIFDTADGSVLSGEASKPLPMGLGTWTQQDLIGGIYGTRDFLRGLLSWDFVGPNQD